MSVTETGRSQAPRRFNWSRSRMREDVLGLPAAEIELGPGRQEVETGLRQRGAALARQHRIQALAQSMPVSTAWDLLIGSASTATLKSAANA